MGAAGRAHVEASFAWERTFERLFAAYGAVLRHPHAVAPPG
jgi:hypothetical protein